MMRLFEHDLLLAFRLLRGRAGFSALVVIVLGVGIGATTGLCALVSIVIPGLLSAQNSRATYPLPPRSLAEAREIALAMSAAPAEISSRADVWVLRGSDFVKVRTGSNGCACMVSRDLHAGSLYPMCFDQQASRTLLLREMRETSLRAKGLSETAVRDDVALALERGEIPRPMQPAVVYMMSRSQVLFSSPLAEGFRVGTWSPHLMIFQPGVTQRQLGLADDSKVEAFSFSDDPGQTPALIVKVPTWSDGTPATTTHRP